MQTAPTQWNEHRLLHTVQIPALRLAGFVALLGFVALDNLVAPDHASPTRLAWFAGGTFVYCGLSWLLLHLFFGKTGSLHLGVVFLTLDIVLWVLAIYFTGGQQSWFLPLLVIRTADQMGGGFRKTLWYAHVSSGGYFLLVLYLLWVEQRTISWATEFLKLGGVYVVNWYLCLCSRTVSRLRVQIRQARATILELNQVRAELAAEKGRAEEANRAKSEFLAAVNHDIRTSLNGIVGMTELLLGTELAREEREYAEAVSQGSRDLIDLVNGLLDMAKIEARRIDVNENHFELRSLVADVVELAGSLAAKKRLDLASEIALETPRWIMADRGHIRRVLLNLVTNAVKFTNAGRIVIGATATESQLEGIELRFEVTDTGIGIPAEAQARIFEPFFRAGGSGTPAAGTGLGLAICKRLVQAMGGQIGFRSEAGRGTTFWFTIPAKLAHEAPPVDERNEARAGHPRTDEPILVAEDDPVSRKITARILEKLGYEVHTVPDGLDAVEAATHTRYALIFMDCRMPQVDGLEATRRIRTLEGSSRHTPIIALTADVMSEDRERCRAAGMDGHLAKPLDATAILDAIAQQLRASRARVG